MSTVRSSSRKKKIPDNKKKSKGLKNESLDTNDDDLNQFKIALPYDVLQIIFKNLLGRDLCTAAMVSRLWQEVAEYELKRRRLIATLTNFPYSFTLCGWEHHFSNELTNKPMLAFFFNGSRCNPPDCLGKHLPRSCVSVTITNDGVIGENEELESCYNRSAYALLPDDPKVEIEFLAATSSQITHINRKMFKHDNIPRPHRCSYVEPMIKNSLRRLKNVKCMILFTSEKFQHSEKLYRLNVFKDNVGVVWGGVVENLFICSANDAGIPISQNVLWLIILISGPDVKCWSTFVDEKVESKELVVATLMSLKEQIKLQKHTIGFMFSCIARGSEWYNGESNVESTIFKSIFPNIPLIGSIGNGEYGIDSQNKCPFIDGLGHQYSTTFMILTYG